jgi:hypothetical protein
MQDEPEAGSLRFCGSRATTGLGQGCEDRCGAKVAKMTGRPGQPSIAFWPSTSWASLINNVEWCFRSATEAIEASRGHNLSNACLAGLGP